MAAPGRKLEPYVAGMLRFLQQSACRLRFFQAVRLLRRALAYSQPADRFAGPAAEIVRFAANPSLVFPASEIQALDLSASRPGKTHSNSPKMTVNFMGLASPVGVLPAPYVELIVERSHKKIRDEKYDNAFRDFLDIFNHRVISLFYWAWEKYRFYVRYERGEPDQLTPVLLSLIGLGTTGLGNRHSVPDQALVYYSGLLARHPRTAQGLQQILADYFDVDVAIEQFAGKWVKLPPSSQTRVGEQSLTAQLGFGAVVGDEIWDRHSTVRIKLGPLSKKMYLDFLPRDGARAYHSLRSLLRFYSNDQLDFEIQLVLRDEDTPRLELNDNHDLMLGWTTWIRKHNASDKEPLGRDPGEAVLQM